jgi:chemotaxis protein methyltransferase CheR
MDMVKLTDREFETLVTFVYNKYGINLRKKRILIEGRMANTLREKKIESYDQYLKSLFADTTGSEITIFLNKITTNHTFFMREMEHFRFLKDKALPMFEASKKKKEIRIWSAGCSSGQEPYTVSMALNEHFGPRRSQWDISILATDISMDALAKADKAVYALDAIKEVPANWRAAYFEDMRDGTYKICGKVRKDVTFRPLNLNEQFFFPQPFDIIFCRNVMIYFDEITRENLINKFYKVTSDGGFLFVGHSEVVNRRATQYKYVMPAIYQKKED